MMKVVKCGNLSMAIDRSKDALKSQKLVNLLLETKRENADMTIKEMEYVAIGFKTAQRG